MTRALDVVSDAIGRIAGVRAASGAGWRRLRVWGERVFAALKDPEPQSPEEYERELRERVFHPPQA